MPLVGAQKIEHGIILDFNHGRVSLDLSAASARHYIASFARNMQIGSRIIYGVYYSPEFTNFPAWLLVIRVMNFGIVQENLCPCPYFNVK